MYTNLKEIIPKVRYIDDLRGLKNVLWRKNTEPEMVEKVMYRLEGASDWLIYVDGNTWKKMVRGFAFCESGIVFCDDNNSVVHIYLNEITNAKISNTSLSVLINGKCVTLGDVSKIICNCLLLIKAILGEKKIAGYIKIANLSDTNWYIGYNGNIEGPSSKESLIRRIKSNEFEIDELQAWNNRMNSWKFVIEIEELISEIDVAKSVEIIVTEDTGKPCDINQCSKDELLLVPGISLEAAESFLKKRQNGFLLKNIFEFQKEFNLPPHEIERLQSRIVFKRHIVKRARFVDV